MRLSSHAFADHQEMPVRYTGEGLDLSPPLSWSNVPQGCRSFALVCEDPDAPVHPGKDHPFVHWLAYHISPNISFLQEGILPLARVEGPILMDQGINSFGHLGYGGPLPPIGHGIHRYQFTLYALHTDLGVPAGANKSELFKAMDNHILMMAKLTGRYERKSARRSA